jgi:hypothetical protein
MNTIATVTVTIADTQPTGKNRSVFRQVDYLVSRQKGLSVETIFCPFCGSTDWFVERIHLSSYAVQCGKCCATGPLTEEDERKGELKHDREARELWNKRV